MTTTQITVLFGASKAGETYISRNPGLHIIAIADNDRAKHGQTLSGIPIIHPDEIKNLKFDQLVITSLWIDSIKSQLINELGIDAGLIRVPFKHELKSNSPFAHQPTLDLAHELMVTISDYLKKNGLTPYLDSGTLLGLMRDGDLIPWDDDIDFAINEAEFNYASELMKNFKRLAPQKDNISWHLQMISMAGENVCINIEFTPVKAGSFIPFETSLQKRRIVNGRSELVSSAGIFDAPSEHFTGNGTLKAFGHDFSTPRKPELFLEFMYGDWCSPRKEMQLNDYDNRSIHTRTDPRSIAITKRQLE